MNNWIIGLATTALIFMVVTWMLATRCIAMSREIRKLERSNQELKYFARTLRAENTKLSSQVTEEGRITSMRLSLHLKDEKISELENLVKRQNVLLKQKWEGAKK